MGREKKKLGPALNRNLYIAQVPKSNCNNRKQESSLESCITAVSEATHDPRLSIVSTYYLHAL